MAAIVEPEPPQWVVWTPYCQRQPNTDPVLSRDPRNASDGQRSLTLRHLCRLRLTAARRGTGPSSAHVLLHASEVSPYQALIDQVNDGRHGTHGPPPGPQERGDSEANSITLSVLDQEPLLTLDDVMRQRPVDEAEARRVLDHSGDPAGHGDIEGRHPHRQGDDEATGKPGPARDDVHAGTQVSLPIAQPIDRPLEDSVAATQRHGPADVTVTGGQVGMGGADVGVGVRLVLLVAHQRTESAVGRLGDGEQGSPSTSREGPRATLLRAAVALTRRIPQRDHHPTLPGYDAGSRSISPFALSWTAPARHRTRPHGAGSLRAQCRSAREDASMLHC